MADYDCKSHDLEPIPKKEKISPDDEYSGRHWINTHVNNGEIQPSANFLSMSSAGQTSVSSSSSVSNGHPSSTIVTGENLKDYVISTHSSNYNPCRVQASSKSDISSELGPLVPRGSGMDAVKSEERQKHMTESSCSNSIQITLPVSSSNERYLEMSTEMRSAKPHTSGANSSISEGLGSSMVEPVTRGLSDLAAQSFKRFSDNAKHGIEPKVSGLVLDVANKSISNLPKQRCEDGVDHIKEQCHEVDRGLGTARNRAKGTVDDISVCRAASESIGLNKESNGAVVYASSAHLWNSGKNLIKDEEPATTFSRKPGGCGSPYLDIVDQKLMWQPHFSNKQHPLKAPHPLGLYELSPDITAKGLPSQHDLFDLNEDRKELNSRVQSTTETGNPFNVIRVVAKPGVPLSVPMTHRKLEGEMSWKGSATTSAFHPTNSKLQGSQSNCVPTFSKGFSGIDLNVAAAEVNDDSDLRLGVGPTSAPLIVNPSLKVSCSRAERLDFDLNCLGDITDTSQGASLPATSVKKEIPDFKSNEGSLTVHRCDDEHGKNISSQHIARLPYNSPGISFPTNSEGHCVNLTRPAYRPDFNNIQLYSQSQLQPFLMASPIAFRPVEQSQKVVQLQPKLPFAIPTLPPQSYSSGGPFFVYPNGLVTSNLHYPSPMQYTRDPRVHASFPQSISHTVVPSVDGGPHFMSVVQGRSQNEGTNIRPCINIGNGGISAVNESLSQTREFFPTSRCPPVKEQMRVPLKRTEPEGGHGAFQLHTRQLTSWN